MLIESLLANTGDAAPFSHRGRAGALSFLNFPGNRRIYVTRRRFAFVLPERCFAKR
jgi:hypothetical protein